MPSAGFDAIIVLGAAVWPEGRPSPALARRVMQGVRLFWSGAAPVLLMTGGVGRHPPAEAEVMAALAIGAGVPRDRILVEDRAATTYDSARRCAAMLRRHGWSRAILVSDAFHLRRCAFAFRGFGLEVAVSAAGGRRIDSSWRLRAYHACRERAGIAWYAVRLTAARLGYGYRPHRENEPAHPRMRRPSRTDNGEQTGM